MWTILLPLHCECCDYGFYYPAKYIIIAIMFNFLITLHIYIWYDHIFLHTNTKISQHHLLKSCLKHKKWLISEIFYHLILLVCGSIYITVLHHFPYCSFVLTSEIRKSNSTETVLFQTCSIILDLLKNMYKL